MNKDDPVLKGCKKGFVDIISNKITLSVYNVLIDQKREDGNGNEKQSLNYQSLF